MMGKSLVENRNRWYPTRSRHRSNEFIGAERRESVLSEGVEAKEVASLSRANHSSVVPAAIGHDASEELRWA